MARVRGLSYANMKHLSQTGGSLYTIHAPEVYVYTADSCGGQATAPRLRIISVIGVIAVGRCIA
jgi:hypothetical protein